MNDYQKSPLWMEAFESKGDGLDKQRQMLISAYADFRDRVSMLVAQIHKDMPSLTVHDITHIDALWWTASEITGEHYPLNPAEAFVLGGAFLLHDSAHCIAAYPGGIEEIKALPEWKMYCSILGLEAESLIQGTEDFQKILFEVLRSLHPKQAKVLARQSWSTSGDKEQIFLLPQDDLRRAYAEVIGTISESHWHYPHQLEMLNHSKIMPAAYLHPAPWTVDVLKLALILRTSDAAHIDSQRAPKFLQALVNPSGLSLTHWNFQSRINKPKRDPDPIRKELCFSGTSFPLDEQNAWWLAYDTARMVDHELRVADRLLVDFHRNQFAVRSVANSHSSENFARNVPTDGWHPVDTSVKITDINKMVERFGGEKLYGNHPSAALRELIQNSVDSIHACRNLGGLGDDEGEIELAIENSPQGEWLSITDTGLGMSRYVLTEVLLDFGKSLWRSADLQGEWQNLISSKFEATGKFGIGFFSVFMLGTRVRIVTRRFEPKEHESSQWLLDFSNGTQQRPTLRTPADHEKLKRHGTKISVLLPHGKLVELCEKKSYRKTRTQLTFAEACAKLVPTLDINLFTQTPDTARTKTIKANDWLSIDNIGLIQRICPGDFDNATVKRYGPWSTMKEIRNEENCIIGKASVSSENSYRYNSLGVGVYNGILAGNLEGIAGVINVIPQNDLARTSAIPLLTTAELAVWANEQATTLIQRDEISAADSALLANFGSDPEFLTIGKLGGSDISYEDFQNYCIVADTILLYDGYITHDDDDEVLSRQFYGSFEHRENVFELHTIFNLRWIESLVQNGPAREGCSTHYMMHSIIEKIWGTYDIEQTKAHVGTVHGENIYRDCDVYTRINEPEA